MQFKTHFSFHIERDAEKKRPVKAHLQDVVPVLRLQQGLEGKKKTQQFVILYVSEIKSVLLQKQRTNVEIRKRVVIHRIQHISAIKDFL